LHPSPRRRQARASPRFWMWVVMIALILAAAFPPKPESLGKVPLESVTLHMIRSGEIAIVSHDDTWAGNVKEWRQGRWNPAFTQPHDLNGVRKSSSQAFDQRLRHHDSRVGSRGLVPEPCLFRLRASE